MIGEEMEEEVLAIVVVDADLGLQAKLKLPSGSSVATLKQELCERDYTDGLAAEDVILSLADEEGNPLEPLSAVRDDFLLVERSTSFVLLDEAPPAPPLPPSEPQQQTSSTGTASASTQPAEQPAEPAEQKTMEPDAAPLQATEAAHPADDITAASDLALQPTTAAEEAVPASGQSESEGAAPKAKAKSKAKGKAKAKAKAKTSEEGDPKAAAPIALRSDEELVAAAKEALGRGKDEAEEEALRQQAESVLPSLNAALASSKEGAEEKGKDRQGNLLVARGLLHWRFSMLSAAFEDLRHAATLTKDGKMSFLALLLCLSRWREAKELCQELGEQAAAGAVQEFFAAADKMNNLFLSKEISMEAEDKEIVPGVVQTDILLPAEGAQLGVRCLFRVSSGGVKVFTKKPLVLIFHSEEETVDNYSKAEFLDLLPEAHVIVAGFRGFGFSSGSPACLARLRSDGDAVVDVLPGLFAARGLPWPWQGGLTLYGTSLGSRVACYLAALRGEATFTGGLVLESAWCGSFAPGAKPLPEPPRHMALAAMGSNAMGDSRFGSRELSLASLKVGREAGRLLPIKPKGGTSQICYVRGSEDYLRAYTGKLLLFHGELDHVVPPEHAKRLFHAAESAKRRLVLVRGKRFDSVRAGPEYERELRLFLEGD